MKRFWFQRRLALSKYSAKPPAICAFPYSHTNGLASGNVLEEAICHALCEVIERDASSIADLCASSIPYSYLRKNKKFIKKSREWRISMSLKFLLKINL